MLIAMCLLGAYVCHVLLALLVPAAKSMDDRDSLDRGAKLLFTLFMLVAFVGKYALIFYAGMLAGGVA